MTRNPPTQEHNLPPYMYDNAYEDEINLVDIWLVLMKRRRYVAAVAGLCVLAGILYALMLPAKYQYSTSIEIGSRSGAASLDGIETPETVLAKITESYIPLARQDYLTQHPELTGVPNVTARIPKGSQIVVLNGKGPETQGEAHKAVQQAVVDLVKKDHGRIINVLRKETEIRQNQALAKLEELKDSATLIQAREKRLVDISVLLTSQAEGVREDLARATSDRARAIAETKDESRALTLMMLENGMQQYRQRLAQIDERLK